MAVIVDFPRPAPALAAPVLFGPADSLVQAVRTVAAQDVLDLPDAQAVAECSVLLAQLEALTTVVLLRVGDVDRRSLHVLTGAPTVGTWLGAQQTSLDRAQLALARRLPGLPVVAAELSAQRLSVLGAQRLAAALSKLRRHVDRPDGLIDGQDGQQVVTAVLIDGIRQLICEAHGGLAENSVLLVSVIAQLAEIAGRPVGELARLEAGMVLLARHLQPGLLASGLTRLVDAVLPNELERRAADAHADRRFTMRRHDDGSGWVITEGELDLECGELLHTVLTAELTADPDNPADTQKFTELRKQGWTSEQELPVCAGPRSLRQRRHDALKNSLRRYLDAGISGLRDNNTPHLAVTVGLDTLHHTPGALPATGSSGATLPVSLVRRWSCDSNLTRFVLSLGRKVIETSHNERTLKAHERRAVHLQTGGICPGAGCTRGPGCRLIPHHGNPWTRCHTTSLADTVLLCEQTHHQLHTGHTIRLKDGRWLGPDGWTDGPSGHGPRGHGPSDRRGGPGGCIGAPVRIDLVTEVYLEQGRTWTFACALDWPGWARRGKGNEAALEQLLAYADRYAAVLGSFEPGDLHVVGTLPGNATTDFGAPDARGAWDELPLDAAGCARLADVLGACWDAFDRIAAASPSELRKGPRGGGRDRDAVVDHVREAERSYGRKLGARVPPRTSWEQQRSAIVEAVRAGAPEGSWPLRYAVRRLAWHVLDHAWEIEDKRVSPPAPSGGSGPR